MRRRHHHGSCGRDDWADPARLRALWPDCSARDLRALHQCSSLLLLRAGQLVACQGRHGREMLLLVEGEAFVTVGLDIVATVRAGAPVGEMALVRHTPRNATVFMASDGAALVLTPPELRQLTWTSPYFSDLVAAFVESRARERAAAPGP